jgi:two-component sensor histidine kinase/CheY-like chemotaxis protein
LPEDSSASVLDRDGVIVARTRDPDRWVGHSATPELRSAMARAPDGSVETGGLEGVGMMVAWVRSARTGWRIVIGRPVQTLTATLSQNYLLIALAGILALGFGIAVAALLSGRIVRSVAALSKRAVAVGAGSGSPFVPSGVQEIDDVNQALTLAAELINERAKQRDSAEEQQRLLMAEIDHRGKNLLANVQAIANRTLPDTPQTKSFTGRLMALARVHNLLAQSRWRGASLRTLLDSTLEPYATSVAQQILVRGDDVLLRPSTAQALSLILNELATNANKHGALSDPDGRLVIEITQARESNSVVIRWVESNKHPIQAPSTQGFGSVLVERLARELPGSVERIYHASGLECRITLLLSEFGAVAQPAPILPKHHVAQTPHENTAILIVEDSALAAHELSAIVSEAGFAAIGPATTVAEALQVVQEKGKDVSLAILDVNLNGETVFPVAYALRDRKIPFVFVTGYEDRHIRPTDLRDVYQLRKPVQAFQLLDAISASILNSAAHRAKSGGH